MFRNVWSRISLGFSKRVSNTCFDLVYFHSENQGDSNRTNYRGQNCVVLITTAATWPISFGSSGD